MADKTTKGATQKDIEKALTSLGPVAQVVGKSAEALWKIFVMRYRALGLASLFTAACIVAVSLWLLGDKTHWLLMPFALAAIFMYVAIYLLVNPYYPAMNDVLSHLKDLKEKPTAEIVQAHARSGYYS